MDVAEPEGGFRNENGSGEFVRDRLEKARRFRVLLLIVKIERLLELLRVQRFGGRRLARRAPDTTGEQNRGDNGTEKGKWAIHRG